MSATSADQHDAVPAMAPADPLAPPAAARVSESTLWGASPDGPLCLRVHHPVDGLARGAVLLCPPLGREHVVSHPTFRQLAEELAMAGFVSFRLDYHGTGDSAGHQHDPDRVAAWKRSVVAALGQLRATCEGPVAVVGMRMGATLAAGALAAAAASGGPRADLLVLWDPCHSGNSWLREQRALLQIGVGSSGYGAVPTEGDAEELALASLGRDELVDIPSFSFPAGEAAGISGLDFTGLAGDWADQVVVLHRVERQPRASFVALLAGHGATQLTCEGQSELLVMAADFALVPVSGLRGVVAVVSEAAPDERLPFTLPPPEPVSLSVSRSSGDRAGVTVIEEHVALGPLGLVGVRTGPERPLRGSPLLLLLGNSNEPHFGPSRAWVELSRSWAASGVSSVRVCLSGLGDSPVRPGQSPQVIYAREALEDVKDLVAAADPASGARSNVVLIGLCSGGYEAVEGALAVNARGVCVLGLIPGSGQPIWARSAAKPLPDPVASGLETQRQAAINVRGLLHRGAQSPTLWKIARKIPQPLFRLADLIGVLPSPARPLMRLSNAGVDTLFLVGTRDARPYRVFAAGVLRRLERRGFVRFRNVPALDHGMLRGGPREQALRLLDEHVREKYVRPYLAAAS